MDQDPTDKAKRRYICLSCEVGVGAIADEEAAKQRAEGHDLVLDAEPAKTFKRTAVPTRSITAPLKSTKERKAMSNERTTGEILDLLSNAGIDSREDYYTIINVLYERAAALPLDATHGAYYCHECGSTNVDYEGWQRPNENDRPNGGLDRPASYCNECEESETVFHSDEPPLFCKCLRETQSGDVLMATWPDEKPKRVKTCPVCKAPYTTTRPEPEEEPEPRPTTTCANCGQDYPDAEMMPRPGNNGGELCSTCYHRVPNTANR